MNDGARGVGQSLAVTWVSWRQDHTGPPVPFLLHWTETTVDGGSERISSSTAPVLAENLGSGYISRVAAHKGGRRCSRAWTRWIGRSCGPVAPGPKCHD